MSPTAHSADGDAGQIEGLADGVFEPGPAAWADLEAEVARMRCLATDLGDLSHVAEGRIEVHLGPIDLRVIDTGRGLASDDLKRVFERFYRVPDATTGRPREGGTGIGLTVSRGLAQAMGGSLRATSAGVGQGAEFVLTLPVSPTRTNSSQPADPMPRP